MQKELYQTDATFANDASYWYLTHTVSGLKYSTCAGTYLLAGNNVLGTGTSASASSGDQYGDYIQRTYSNLNAHTMVRFQINMWAIDSWDVGTNDGMYFLFDGRLVDGWHLNLNDFPSNICGSQWNELPNIIITGSVAHTASTLDFRMYAYFNEPSYFETFGIRDVTMMFADDAVQSETLCAYSVNKPSAILTKQCSCPTGQYWTGSSCATCNTLCTSCWGPGANQCYSCVNTAGVGFDGRSCVNCYTGCSQCFGSASNECLSCNTNYYYFPYTKQCIQYCGYPLTITSGPNCAAPCSVTNGNNCVSPCATPTNYIYPDQTCSATCSFPMQSKLTFNSNIYNLCIFPCSSNDFLYWDGTCQTNCLAPLTSTISYNRKFCKFGCTTITNYLYPDGSCSTTCTFPLVPWTVNGRNLCISPCTTTGHYLYWSQQCDTCAYPLTTSTINGVPRCVYPCSGTDYLYWNQTCHATCDFPLSVRIQWGKRFCDYPAATTDYLYWDGTSSSSCLPPLGFRNEGTPIRNYCDFLCQVWEYLYWDKSCSTECIFPLVKVNQNGRQFCTYPCTGTNYLYWNGTCLPTCPSPPFTQRTYKTQRFCDFPAGDTSYFLYWDGSLLPTCDLPLNQRIEGSPLVRQFCDYKCPSSQVLYWDGSCQSSCNSPGTLSTIKGFQLCNFPCPVGKFLNYDNNCVDTCYKPFITTVSGIAQYCNHPCTPTSNYYYWNTSCISTCPSPHISQKVNNINWCVFPCAANQYLHTNGSCLESCDAPYYVTIESGMKRCINTCPNSQYLLPNGTCISSCSSPMRQETNYNMNGAQICLPPCDNPHHYYYPETKTCGDHCYGISETYQEYYLECIIPEVDTSSALDLILEASNSSIATLVSFNKLVQYTKYVDIQFPPRLQKLAYGKGRNVIALKYSQPISKKLQALFPLNSLPAVFERYSQPSDFIVNFWGNLASWIIVIIAAVLFTAFENICKTKNWAKARDTFERLKIITKWNLLLVLIGASLDDVVFFSSLEFRSLHLNSSIAGLSLEVCLVMITLLLVFTMGIVHLARQLKNLKSLNSSRGYEEFLLRWQGYQVLYRGFNHSVITNRLFYLVYIIRLILPSLVAAWLFVSPVLQTALYVFINLAIILYIAILKPLLSKINHVQLLLLEATAFVINTSMFVLVISDRSEVSPSSDFSIMVGDIIVFGNSVLNILILVFLFVKIFQAFKSIYQAQRNLTRKDQTQYVQILVSVVQQAGLGFEELYTDPQAQFMTELNHMEDDREKELLRKGKKRTLVNGQKMSKFTYYGNSGKFSPKLTSTIRSVVNNRGKVPYDPQL